MIVFSKRFRLLAAAVLCIMASISARAGVSDSVTIKVTGGQLIEVQAVAPGIFHIRLGQSAVPSPSLQERYGVVRTDWSGVQVEQRSTADTVTLSTADGDMIIDKASGSIELRDHAGRMLSPGIAPILSNLSDEQRRGLLVRAKTLVESFRNENTYPSPDLGSDPQKTGAGFGLTVRLQPNERFYGLGTGSKQHIQLRGQAIYNWVSYMHNEQPVPFVMSSAGWGLFINTSWRHYVDIGKSDPNQMLVWGPEGDLDFFLIIGSGLPEVLDRYTQITGRPMLLPEWAYGLTWINHVASNQFEVLENAKRFREEHIPIDGFGLDAGWAKGGGNDCSTKLEWNTGGFYIPEFMKGKGGQNQTFVGALRRLGFKSHLWVCTDYDLTAEEERVIDEREHKPVPPEPEAWFTHLKTFLDDGEVGWKFDPAHLVDRPNPTKQYANGHTESEMHNLNQVLLVKQVNQGQEQYTSARPMMQYCGGWAGTQHWGASTVGDVMAGPDGMTWMLSSGMSGYMNTSGDMWVNRPVDNTMCKCGNTADVFWPEGASIHLGFLSAWTLTDGWGYLEQPWLAGEKLEKMFKDYARLRYSLLPYIYSTAYNGTQTGMPIMRAMPLMFPRDAELQDSIRQYMFGDFLMVTAFTPKVRFPAGRWIDYWTGKEYTGPLEITYSIPEGRGGGLFIKAGAILPYQPDMDYVGQKPVDALALHVYPEGRSGFTLYEDDGLSIGYEKGAAARTDISSQKDASGELLTIAPRKGTYAGMPDKRSFEVYVHGAKPQQVLLNGKVLNEGPHGWHFDGDTKTVRLEVQEDSERQASQVVSIR
jgi:alpha-glucosidase (family GH31 glycosyl hydrolase)